MSDLWRDVKGYEGRYQVSSFGRVRSINRVTNTLKGSRVYKGKILGTTINDVGYPVVNLRINGKTLQSKIHRLVAEMFLGPPNGLQVNHKDLDKTNNDVTNLEYVTNSQNSLHAHMNEARCGKTVLYPEQRKVIRAMRKKGITLKEIGKQFGVSESAVSEVARGTTWAWENK